MVEAIEKIALEKQAWKTPRRAWAGRFRFGDRAR
jgi:hypothetical protein